jgi:hypothetical protein
VRQGFPQENKSSLRELIDPKIVALQVIPVRAIAWRPMHIERQVDAPRPAGVQVFVDAREDSLIQVEVIEVLRPETIIERNSNEVESELREKIERLLIGWPGSLARIPGTHPLEVEAIMLRSSHTASRFQCVGHWTGHVTFQ